MNLSGITLITASLLLLYVAPIRAQQSPQSPQSPQTQGSQQAPPAQPVIRLSPDKLKACEGYFRSPKNNDMVIQFATEDGGLTVKLLWVGRTFKMITQSDSSFQTAEAIEGRPIPINFIKDDQGIYSRVKVINGEIWTRSNDYKPFVRMESAHTPEQLKPFEGLYQLHGHKGTLILIKERDNKLILKQYWDGQEIPFVPDSTGMFFFKEQKMFTLKFNKDDKGAIKEMVAVGSDHWDPVKKAEFTGEQLKRFEGKYRLKDDSDDLIRITARSANLVVKQLWDGKEIIVEPISGSFFFNNDQTYSVNFEMDNDGTAIRVLILDTDLFEKVKE